MLVVIPGHSIFSLTSILRWSNNNSYIDARLMISMFINSSSVFLTYLFLSGGTFWREFTKILQKSDPVYGDRYSVDLQLGLPYTEKSYRFSDRSTCIKKKGTNSLCLPEGIEWNGNATVYIILPVKDQLRWVYHFINDLTVASLLTGDKNFHVIVADFESQDIDLAKAFDTALLRGRHTIINLTGKFYKTLALGRLLCGNSPMTLLFRK